MTTAIQLKSSNFQYIALRTPNASVSDLELCYDSMPSGEWFIVKDYVGLDGTVFADWTTISKGWLDTHFEFDSEKAKTMYVPLIKRAKPKVATS